MARRVVMTFTSPDIKIDTSPLSSLGVEFEGIQCLFDQEKLIEAGSDADAMLIIGLQPFTRRVIESFPKCRLLAIAGIGYDQVDLTAATEQGICVANNPYYCLDEVSDHALALLLACARKITRVDQVVKAKQWDAIGGRVPREVLPPMFRLRGKTLGLLGFGNIARTLLPKALGFGLKVIVHDPYVAAGLASALGAELVSFDRLLADSDFISVHAPLTEQNRHLLGLDQFKKMKRTAYLINTARGGLVDEKALVTAVREGYIAGAGLDVTEQEPLALDSPLLSLDNVILTAHSAHFSEESNVELWRWPVEEIVRVLNGGWPLGLVNPGVKDIFNKKWRG